MSVFVSFVSWFAGLLLAWGVGGAIVYSMATGPDWRLLPWAAVWGTLCLGILGHWLSRWCAGWVVPSRTARQWLQHRCDQIQPWARWGFSSLFLIAGLTQSRYPVGFPGGGGPVGFPGGGGPVGSAAIWPLETGWTTVPALITLSGPIAAALAIVPELRILAGSSLTGFVDLVFFPGAREKRPPFSLKTARALLKERQYTKAERELERVLSHWPANLEVWIERVRLAIAAEGGEAAEGVLAEALRRLKKQQEKEKIFQFWQRETRRR